MSLYQQKSTISKPNSSHKNPQCENALTFHFYTSLDFTFMRLCVLFSTNLSIKPWFGRALHLAVVTWHGCFRF